MMCAISLTTIFDFIFFFDDDNESVHEHGLVVAPEQLSLLDESVGKKMKNKSGTSPSNIRKSASSPAGSPTGRYDYSIVQHLDSTDI